MLSSFSVFLITTTLILLLSSSALAVDSSDLCANNTLLYSPFTPWFKAWPNITSGPSDNVKNLVCWWYADCSYGKAPDTRKQQYAATGLVMGLIPLILKDIAWPQRRIAAIPRQQPWYIETVLRALGLNPIVTSKRIRYGRRFQKRWQSQILLALLVADLVIAYAALAVIELYSKRSALGCPVPVFVVLWFVAAIVPSALEVGAARYQGRRKKNDRLPNAVEQQSVEFINSDNAAKVGLSVVAPDSVPGGDQAWIVQVFWAFYYSAGTLIFSSIMLVTVVELVVWVLAASTATAASKMLGYKLCGYWGLGLED